MKVLYQKKTSVRCLSPQQQTSFSPKTSYSSRPHPRAISTQLSRSFSTSRRSGGVLKKDLPLQLKNQVRSPLRSHFLFCKTHLPIIIMKRQTTKRSKMEVSEKNLVTQIVSSLEKRGNEQRKNVNMRYFKTGTGQYGEGDIFFGVSSPEIKQVAKSYGKLLSAEDYKSLFAHKVHEVRSCACVSLVNSYKSTKDTKKKGEYVQVYLDNRAGINNWDLVDISAHKILGAHSFHHDKNLMPKLYAFAKSDDLWERRIAIISTLYHIQQNSFSDTISICKILMNDKEDLIHKATGWMLREVGKRSKSDLISFLDTHAHKMPRTCLRYSLEKLSTSERKLYMNKKKEMLESKEE